jgi:CheY-like chemotaxis protein
MQTKPYVLAVDDEPVNRYILEDFLEEAFELLVLESGQACLHAVRQRKPDLILMDISMPGMDGYEVCRRLQSDPQTREIPLIFLTAKVETMDEKLGFDLGAVDYITKPFTEAILLARIRTHLSLSAARRRLETHNAVLCRERAHVEEMILRMREDTQFVAQGIQCLLTPLERTNGDLLLSAQTPDGRRYLMIGDFTGHGLCWRSRAPLWKRSCKNSIRRCLANCQRNGLWRRCL